jgi:hypothetical protein
VTEEYPNELAALWLILGTISTLVLVTVLFIKTAPKPPPPSISYEEMCKRRGLTYTHSRRLSVCYDANTGQIFFPELLK